MKRFSTLLILSFLMMGFYSTPTLKAQEPAKIKWYSIEEAVKLNKKHKKKFFIDVYTDWCGWCKKMDSGTFTDPVIVEYMNKNFYAVKLDAETQDTIVINEQTYVSSNPGGKRASHNLAIALLNGKMSYPSFVFLDDEVKLITVLPGFNPPEKLEPVLHFIADEKYKDIAFDQYLNTFKGSFNKE